MWFWLALIALVCWSGSDLFSKIGSAPDDKTSHLKMVAVVGLVMGLHACYEIFINGIAISFSDILTYLPASILYILSMAIGYVGLRYIELSISSPICNSSGAITAILCFFILGQRMDTLSTIAVVIVCIGVILLGVVEMTEDPERRLARQQTANRKYTRSWIALLIPVIYCLLDAAGTFADSMILDTGMLDENVANIAYELTFFVVGIPCFIYAFLVKRQKPTVKRDLPKLIAAIFETGGQFAYVFAIGANAIAAAPMISAYCVLSVVWSRIFLKEKLSAKHYITILITVVGIILLGLAEGFAEG